VSIGKYGVEGGFILGGGNKASIWWEDLVRVKEGRGLLSGRWFDDNVTRVVGDRESSSFWTDDWLGGASLKVRFCRLFVLYEHKKVSIVDMRKFG
jgi:hypothetical protein